MDHHWLARDGSLWPVQRPGGQVLLRSARRRVIVLAQQEAVRLNHGYIGTEHILLGLIREGDGVAAQVLVKLGADLNRVRQQVIELLHGRRMADINPGQAIIWNRPSGAVSNVRNTLAMRRSMDGDERQGPAILP